MSHRCYGRLATTDIGDTLTERSVLCLPIGSHEQHGPHLPLHTDTIVADGFTRRLVAHYGDSHDLFRLPAIPYGLSLEHAGAAGTISLTTAVLTSLLDTLIAEYVRATPARAVLIVNGHGGNRGILEAAIYEFQRAHKIRACVVHPSSLATVRSQGPVPEIHAGARETSLMLALAPDDVHLERLTPDEPMGEPSVDEIDRLIRDRGATWPWESTDPRIARAGVIGGDPRQATAELGEAILASAIDACAPVLDHLTTADHCPRHPRAQTVH
jgi:creatinine amidohydrolase